MSAGQVHVLGIRHHGPGCARAVLGALASLRPDVVLVEGPADAQSSLEQPLSELTPPVALLVYAPEEPGQAAFYPFARFSPEWNAIAWAQAEGVPVRLIDLPRAIEPEGDAEGEPAPLPERIDPLGVLAEAAGFSDRELWWERQVEQRQDPTALFAAILEAMTELREAFPALERREALREAHMRQAIRQALKEGHQQVVVICGAWHAPALAGRGPAKADAELLKGLVKVKTAATWIPWTHSRLASRSGYGAGVTAPGWYRLLWDDPTHAATRWIAEAARLLRDEDLDASVASVVETQRLAEALAAMRAAPVVGLPELTEAIEAVLCQGEPTRLALVRDRLELAEELGAVPDHVALGPLQRDLDAQQKRLRLKPSPEDKRLELDLREENGRARSALLYRMRLLDVPWGRPEPARRAGSTFHEDWKLRWEPEFAVALIEQSVWGLTVEAAAAARVSDMAKTAELPALTGLLHAVVLAALPQAAADVLARVRDAGALATDVGALMEAVPALARVARYGDVRGTASDPVLAILKGLLERIMVGLPAACVSLDDAAALARSGQLGPVQQAIELLRLDEERASWQATLLAIADTEALHGRVRGTALRLLLAVGALDEEGLTRRAGLALSPAVEPAQAAAWIGGLVAGAGTVLVHLDGLWRALDAWLAGLGEEAFVELLPLLRKAFADFDAAERRAMGEKVARLGQGGAARLVPTAELDRERAELVVPVILTIVGGAR